MDVKRDSALARSARTLIQATIGLFVAVWAVPGVPEVVQNYVSNNLIPSVLGVGGIAAVAAFVWNKLRGVPTT